MLKKSLESQDARVDGASRSDEPFEHMMVNKMRANWIDKVSCRSRGAIGLIARLEQSREDCVRMTTRGLQGNETNDHLNRSEQRVESQFITVNTGSTWIRGKQGYRNSFSMATTLDAYANKRRT